MTIIIPSKNPVNLQECIDALWRHEETALTLGWIKIVTVTDGDCWDFLRSDFEVGFTHPPGRRVRGIKPFVFARNVNLGIVAAGRDDVVILNDDALLLTGAFSHMAAELTKSPEFGLVSASCNNVGNANQHWQLSANLGGGPIRDEPRMVCFVAVLIPRSTIDKVGLLDERFVDYGLDDDDYCLRVRKAGLKIGVYDGCFVDHGALQSTFRPGNRGGDFSANLARFKEKWGAGNMEL